ncbi:MAG: SpoVG family protein [Oscillospiraceae bacterium]|nr:SpoVG family protein [Oscillospiraceae bacterium]
MADTKLDVRVYPIDEPKGNTKAFASVGIDDTIAIRGARVVEGEKGMYVTMPQSKDKENNYHDIAYPLSGDLRKEISAAVLAEYEKMANIPPNQRGYEAPDMSAANNIKAQDIQLDIRVYPLEEPKGSTKAFASVGIDDMAAIRGIRVVEGEKGLFVTMPQSKDSEGEYHDIAFPLNGDLRKEISKAVLKEYETAEKTVDRKPSLAEGLRDGAARAAEQTTAPRAAAAKSHGSGVLE